MNCKKTIITLSLAAMMMPAFAIDYLPLGAPDFSKIKETDYLPAFEKAIEVTKDESLKPSIAEYLRNACYRFREEPGFQEKYDKYSKIVSGE